MPASIAGGGVAFFTVALLICRSRATFSLAIWEATGPCGGRAGAEYGSGPGTLSATFRVGR
jgi:hypothetical protein